MKFIYEGKDIESMDLDELQICVNACFMEIERLNNRIYKLDRERISKQLGKEPCNNYPNE